MHDDLYILISAHKMQQKLQDILVKNGFEQNRALQCADVFTTNSLEGVYTHGINRFPRFVNYVNDGFIKPNANPILKNKFGGIEQWNGNLAPGISNAIHATDRAMQLAQKYGIGCVALSNTNHWMRGGYYGRRAAKEDFIFIGFTNTIANMPAWKALDSRLGNNPLVLAMPYKDDPIVLDMAMSQYSFGAMELSVMKNEKLSVPGGYTTDGQLTDDPAEIMKSKRPLPVGYWKGAGLALLLDLLAAVLSGGLSTHEITRQQTEHSVSQVFICIDKNKLNNSSVDQIIENIIIDYKASIPISKEDRIIYPAERTRSKKETNTNDGIPVLKIIWNEIFTL